MKILQEGENVPTGLNATVRLINMRTKQGHWIWLHGDTDLLRSALGLCRGMGSGTRLERAESGWRSGSGDSNCRILLSKSYHEWEQEEGVCKSCLLFNFFSVDGNGRVGNRKRRILREDGRASLVAQWLRICLLMQGTRVRALVWEDPTCRGAAGPVSHNYWACASGACAPQQERPRQWEARAPRGRVAPACHN